MRNKQLVPFLLLLFIGFTSCHPHKEDTTTNPCAGQASPSAKFDAYVKVGSKYYLVSDTLWLEKGGNSNPAKGPNDTYWNDTTLPMAMQIYLVNNDSMAGNRYAWYQITNQSLLAQKSTSASLLFSIASIGNYTYALKATKNSGATCAKADSVIKTLIVAFNPKRISPLEGHYKGANTDAPSDSFTVVIKMSNHDSTQSFGYKLSIYNLPNHYQSWTALGGSNDNNIMLFDIYNTAFYHYAYYRSGPFTCDTSGFCTGNPYDFFGEIDEKGNVITINYSYDTFCTSNATHISDPVCESKALTKQFVGRKISQ